MRLSRNVLMEGDGGAAGGGAGDAGEGGSGDGGEFDFRAHIPEELRSDPTLTDIKDLPGLASSYVNAQRMLGGSIRIPGEDAGEDAIADFRNKLMSVPGMVQLPDDDDPDGLNAFFTKLGRPESPDKYEIEVPDLGKSLQVDEDSKTEFLKVAHESGLNQKQVKNLMKWYFADVMDKQAQLDAGADAAMEALRSEWGGAYDQRMGAANVVLNEFGDEQLVKEISGDLGNYPGLAKMLSEIGMKMMEGNIIQGNGGDRQDTIAEIQAKIDEIKANPAYIDKKDPQHKSLVEKVNNLYAALSQ